MLCHVHTPARARASFAHDELEYLFGIMVDRFARQIKSALEHAFR
jgi:hypothetical protein